MNTGNSIVLIGLMLLSACGGTPDTAPAANAQDTATASPGATADPFAPAAADDAQPCSGADTGLSGARREEYRNLVADAMDHHVKPGAIEVDRFIGIDTWSAVLATTPVADPGWFVFELSEGRQQFKDVWGGMADEDDRSGLVEWATDLGAPADFAACFAETLVE